MLYIVFANHSQNLSRFAHNLLSDFMENRGFCVTKHYLGLKTAFRAEYTHGTGGRTLGINSEMDALPGIGHACGHNLIAISGVGIALAIKFVLEKYNVPGKVVLLGTPGTAFGLSTTQVTDVSPSAEESGGGKIILLDRGAYKGMDACLMSVYLGKYIQYATDILHDYSGAILLLVPSFLPPYHLLWQCNP